MKSAVQRVNASLRESLLVAAAAAIVLGCGATAGEQILGADHPHPTAGQARSVGSPVLNRSSQPPASTSTSAPAGTPPSSQQALKSSGPTGGRRDGVGSAPSMPAPPAIAGGAPDAPRAITIAGAADVSAPVRPVGMTPDGEMEIPEQVDTVGWYRFGPRPGAAAGSMVIVGHVDSAAQGIGAFFRLHEAIVGTPIEVITGDRHVYRYTVTHRVEFSKHNAPIAALFSRSGRPRLTLITCGGAFDPATGSYLDNIVVTALPVSGPA